MQLVKRLGTTLLVVSVSLVFSQQLYADSLSLSLAADSAEFGFNTGGDYSDSVDWGMTAYFNSVQAGDEKKQISDKMASLEMETALEGDSSSRGLFALGGSIYVLALDLMQQEDQKVETNFSAGITLGGKVGYMLTTAVPSIFYVSAGISPNIVNTGKVEYLRTAHAMFELMLSPAAILQIGYRNYHADLDKRYDHLGETSRTFENRVIGGIKLRF